MRRFWIMKSLAFLVLAPLFLAALGVLVMLLWNALVPSLFAGPVLSFWQAAGLLVLCRLLFGGFRPRHHGHHHSRHRAWRERWHRMSPQERDRFRDGIRRWKAMSRSERREFRRGFGDGGFRGPFGACGSHMHDEATAMHGERAGDEPKGV